MSTATRWAAGEGGMEGQNEDRFRGGRPRFSGREEWGASILRENEGDVSE